MRRLRTIVLRTLGGLAILVVLALVVVRLRYGGGEPYPDVSTEPLLPADAAEVLVELPYPPGNVTASADGRIFFNTHPFAQSHRFADAFLFELVDGQPRPYPSAALQPELRFVFGMTVDRQGRLWVISPATLDRDCTRLQAFDLAINARVVDHEFEPGVARFSQDLRITPDGRFAILADTGAFRFTAASILVVDLQGFAVRRVLDEHPSTQPQSWQIRTAHGPHAMGWGLVTFSVGVDGLAIDREGAWLYYATMSHDTLYRVPTAALLDASLPAGQLAARVEVVGRKPLSDGIELLADGTVIVADVEHGGLVAIPTVGPTKGQLRTLIGRDDVVWADGVTVTPDGAVLMTDSAIPSYLDPLLRPPEAERLAAGRPYRIYRVPAPALDPPGAVSP